VPTMGARRLGPGTRESSGRVLHLKRFLLLADGEKKRKRAGGEGGAEEGSVGTSGEGDVVTELKRA